MKRFFCGFMIVLLLLGGLPVAKGYAQEEDSDNVVDMVTYEKIKALYDERSKLVMDWESNKERIHEIDAEVEALGVRKMSYQEVLEKFGTEAVPYIDLIETEKINWSDVRVVTNYAGQMVELQVIRATPASRDSMLYSSIIKVYDEDSIITKLSKKFLDIVATTALGNIPKIGSALANGIEFADVIKNNNVTTLKNVESSYSCQASVEQVSIWAKYQGSTDATQELSYKGNRISFECGYTINSSTNINGVEMPNTVQDIIKDTIESETYTICETQAAKNFVYYKLYKQELRPDDRIEEITIKTSNKEVYFDIPSCDVTFMRSIGKKYFCVTVE